MLSCNRPCIYRLTGFDCQCEKEQWPDTETFDDDEVSHKEDDEDVPIGPSKEESVH